MKYLLLTLALVVGSLSAAPSSETIYNGIRLPAVWPPKDRTRESPQRLPAVVSPVRGTRWSPPYRRTVDAVRF